MVKIEGNVHMETIDSNFEIIFQKGEHKGIKYNVNMSIPCKNPTCRCTEVLFNFTSDCDNAEEKTYMFSMDVSKKELISSKTEKQDSININFSRSFISEITEEQWKYFYNYFYAYKSKLTKESVKKGSVEIDFTHNEMDIELNGTMTIYNDILPYSEDIIVNYNNQRFLVLDYYCLQSTCNCIKAFLAFYSINKNQKDSEEPTYEGFYNYITGDWDNTTEGNMLITKLKKQYPSINSIIKERHKILRNLYNKYRVKSGKNTLGINNREKIGRNDPCFCGSGKKYKKCCGS